MRAFDRALVHDIVIVRAPTVEDRYGNLVKDWENATRTTVKGWVSQQGAIGRPATHEDLRGREAQVSNWMAYFHPDTDVTGFDRVEWEGITFEGEGPVNPAWNIRENRKHHLEIRLRVVEG